MTLMTARWHASSRALRRYGCPPRPRTAPTAALQVAVTWCARACQTAGSAAHTATGRPVGFQSAVRFKLTPGEVNETNAPSAQEVSKLLPSTQQLNRQLPGAFDLERKYIRPDAVLKKGSDDVSAAAPERSSSSDETVFIPATDPLEDFLDSKDDSKSRVGSVHVLMAYRALAWGTVYALVGFVLVVVACMLACGYHSVQELREGVREKVLRDQRKLQEQVSRSLSEGDVVHEYVIDLTNPAAAWEEARAAWRAIQEIAERESK